MTSACNVVLVAAMVSGLAMGSPAGALAKPLKPLGQYEADGNVRVATWLIERRAPGYQELIPQRDKLLEPDDAAGRSAGRGPEVSPRIVNGVPTVAFPTVGALLHKGGNSVFGAHCSGTLIGCDRFITAAHCIADDLDPENYQVYLQHGGVFSVSKISYLADEYNFPNADVAIVRLSEEVDGITPSPINNQFRIAPPTEGIIVGFGRSGGFSDDYGIKQVGTVVTSPCPRAFSDDNLICWKFSRPVGRPGNDSNTCHGDSGGPFFTPSHPGTPWRVAGVTSGGQKNTCLADDHSYDTSVYQYRKFIREVAGDALNADRCGVLPQVGTGATVVQAEDDVLDAERSRVYFEVDMPPGKSVLRVAMNGEDSIERVNDFDIFVNFGSIATEQTNVCAVAKPGQFAVCQVRNPDPGTWHITVVRKKGQGKVQVVATIFD